MKNFRTLSLSLIVALVLSLAASGVNAQSKILRVDATHPGGSPAILLTVLGKIFPREVGVSLQINTGQTLTRSVLKFGTDDLDMIHFVPQISGWLKNGKRMYKKLPKKANKAYRSMSAIFGFPASAIHIIAWADSGIKTLADIKGKRVFMGPPAGGFYTQVSSYFNVVTGYTPNKDFDAIRLPWAQGVQAMLDGQIDVWLASTAVGSAIINQFGAKKKFVLLGAGKAADSEKWQKVMIEQLLNENATIPAGIYTNQVGGNVRTTAANSFILVRKNLDTDLVYKMVKATWENLDEIHKSAAVLKTLSKSNPLAGVNLPLHPGAVKYYKEIGFKIPAHLLP
ncbi:MAG: TAXI family TRAP transporter solute-binding subunit [Rhodospirillales bacterium]|nr:TAXI family TRAP transporter solute-binding subunit [Rhodospirillales bacterium]